MDSDEHYAFTTEQPVRYVQVANDDGVLGYLWISDPDDAAGYRPREGGGEQAYRAGVSWARHLRACKARGLTPSQALIELTVHAGGGRIGHVVPGSEADAPSLAALREQAATA
ncbi:hypothetical protein [Streptomyces specialis]|uniref:hypothetical protein n=1 Tax=Streptomyces specialis TaxID=498367 RepID=UPI00131B2BDB|nr:hypothetical protein [Streptomyces specialis]